MPRLGAELDKESYQWLEDKNEKLLAAIEADIKQGARPEEVYKLVMRRKDNRKLALMCEAAARHIALTQEPV